MEILNVLCESIMENWNQDQPERYSNFYLYIYDFRGVESGPGPDEVDGKVGVIESGRKHV